MAYSGNNWLAKLYDAMNGPKRTTLIDFQPVMEATALDAGDVAAATQVIPNVFRDGDQGALLKHLTIIDKADQKADILIVFLDDDKALGTLDSAPNISDNDADAVIGWIAVAAADYKDLGGVSVANLKNIDMVLKPKAGTTNLYVGIIATATPTFTASGITLRLGVQRD